MHIDVINTLQFFAFSHLPGHLQSMSRPFAKAALKLAALTDAERAIEMDLIERAQASSLFSELLDHTDRYTPANTQATNAVIKIDEARRMYKNGDSLYLVLNRLIEAKDCAVRSFVYKHHTEVPDILGLENKDLA